MKNPGQLLMVALAVVFAVALCLTIALICIGASQKENPTDTAPSARTRYYIPGTSTSYLAPPTEEVSTFSETDVPGGMVFRRENVPMGIPGLNEFELLRCDAASVRAAREALDAVCAARKEK